MIPYACRPLKAQYRAVNKLLEQDIYLDLTEVQFIGELYKLTGGSCHPNKARQIYYDLRRDAGIPPI